MPPLSLDLRKRIIETYEQGNTSIRKVAQQFQVSKTTVNNLIQLKRVTGQIAPKPPNGGKPSCLLGKEAEAIKRGQADTVKKLVEATNRYKRFIDLDLIFDSSENFLYRQKGQLKLDNTILEEFLPQVVFRSLRNI